MVVIRQVNNTGLREYRQGRCVSAAALARRLGVDKSSLYRYEQPPASAAARVPDRRVMGLIWAWSQGRVGPASFFDLPELE